ncbi:MAG: tetratricopeptide repeat protein [Oleiphilaceae bacterium]|nr:tetratricopeptide repeat protein [Oleiphilaceae bacterium]
MAEMRTEEEQVEAIKNWWKRNGTSLLIGIAAALAIAFGWQAWQTQQAQAQSEAAARYNNLLSAVESGGPDSFETVSYIAKSLQEDFDGSAYSIYGTLILAQQQMTEKNEAANAVESLKWAHDKVEQDGPVEPIVRHRLAQAQFAAGDNAEALATLRGATDADQFAALFAELEGDILLAEGDRAGARQAYEVASDAMEGQNSGLLRLKIADLASVEEG